jgi:hypothetical protein
VPGITTPEEARITLENHPWVQHVQVRYFDVDRRGELVWTWSGQQPLLIHAQRPGKVLVRDGVVRDVIVPTRAQFWQFLFAIGTPDAAYFLLMHQGADSRLLHTVRYNERNLRLLLSDVACPLRVSDLHHALAVVEVGIDENLTRAVPDFHYNALRSLHEALGC